MSTSDWVCACLLAFDCGLTLASLFCNSKAQALRLDAVLDEVKKLREPQQGAANE